MKFIVESGSNQKTPRVLKVITALSIGVGLAMVIAHMTDSNAAVYVSATTSSIVTFFLV